MCPQAHLDTQSVGRLLMELSFRPSVDSKPTNCQLLAGRERRVCSTLSFAVQDSLGMHSASQDAIHAMINPEPNR